MLHRGFSCVSRWLGAGAILCLSSPCFATSTVPDKPYCPVAFAPSDGARVPANAPAIAIMPGLATNLRFGAALPDRGQTFALAPDPTTPEAVLLVPSKPLDPGVRYAISVASDCETERNQTGSVTFDALAVVALPTQLGSLTADAPSYAEAHLVLTPTPELRAFLPVARFEIRVRGSQWEVLPYGRTVVEGSIVPLRIANLGGPTLESRLCEPGETGIKRFDVDLRAHVAGTTIDPAPAVLADVPIDCTRPAFASDQTPPSSGGCSVAMSNTPRTPAASTMALIFISAAALMRRARRNARSAAVMER